MSQTPGRQQRLGAVSAGPLFRFYAVLASCSRSAENALKSRASLGSGFLAMQDPHIPDLDAIDAVDDWGVRLYAIIGATMTLASTLELAIFRLYQEASSQSTEAAAEMFYRHVKFTYKCDITDRTVMKALAGHQFLSHWPALLRQIQEVAGDLADRNLAGSNPIEDELKVVPNTETGNADMYLRYFVRKNPLQVQIGS